MAQFQIGDKEQGLDGDKTTTGAVCYSSLPSASTEDGRHPLRLGDKTSPCGVCGQIGEIVEGVDWFIWHGIPTAVHDAMIACGCPPGSNRLIAPFRGKSARNVSQAPLGTPSSTALEPSGSNATPEVLDGAYLNRAKTFARTFIVSDSETGLPLANRTFTATVDGKQHVGRTDKDGKVRVEGASAESVVSLHVNFRSPARELTELAGMTTREVRTTTQVETLIYGDTPRPIAITVNDRAATREAIIRKVRELGCQFVERSEWHARPPKKALERDWDYTMIALHNAGRSYSCGSGHEQMSDIQEYQQRKFDDFSYHFGIDCSGVIYEGRDIRYKGAHLVQYNSNVIGIVLLQNLTTPEEGSDYIAAAREILDDVGISTTNEIPYLQSQAAMNLITALKSAFHINHFGGHREFPNQSEGEAKICPGNVGIQLVKIIRAKTRLKEPVIKREKAPLSTTKPPQEL